MNHLPLLLGPTSRTNLLKRSCLEPKIKQDIYHPNSRLCIFKWPRSSSFNTKTFDMLKCGAKLWKKGFIIAHFNVLKWNRKPLQRNSARSEMPKTFYGWWSSRALRFKNQFPVTVSFWLDTISIQCLEHKRIQSPADCSLTRKKSITGAEPDRSGLTGQNHSEWYHSTNLTAAEVESNEASSTSTRCDTAIDFHFIRKRART